MEIGAERPIIRDMKTQNRTAIAALAAAGALWGLSVPLSKLSLAWLSPAWLTLARFSLAAPVLALAGRRHLRSALRPSIAATGAVGFGFVLMLQNAGLERTTVSHAAVVIGTLPVLVALMSLGGGHGRPGPGAWGGYALALLGIGLVAGSSGSGASVSGDLLVLGSAALSAATVVVQPRLLAGRDPAAVTAVQFGAGGLVSLPVALTTGGVPGAPAQAGPALAFVALAGVGTVLPFWLFAFGQARVPAHLAGAYMNLEPVVGAAVGWCALGNAAAPSQIAGALAVLAGIALSTLPGDRSVPAPAPEAPAGPLPVALERPTDSCTAPARSCAPAVRRRPGAGAAAVARRAARGARRTASRTPP